MWNVECGIGGCGFPCDIGGCGGREGTAEEVVIEGGDGVDESEKQDPAHTTEENLGRDEG